MYFDTLLIGVGVESDDINIRTAGGLWEGFHPEKEGGASMLDSCLPPW